MLYDIIPCLVMSCYVKSGPTGGLSSLGVSCQTLQSFPEAMNRHACFLRFAMNFKYFPCRSWRVLQLGQHLFHHACKLLPLLFSLCHVIRNLANHNLVEAHTGSARRVPSCRPLLAVEVSMYSYNETAVWGLALE